MKKTTITILTITFITVIGWIGFDIFHAKTDIDYPPEYKNLKQASPYFDTDLLESLSKKEENDLYKESLK